LGFLGRTQVISNHKIIPNAYSQEVLDAFVSLDDLFLLTIDKTIKNAPNVS